MVLIYVYVPAEWAERVKTACFAAGAGRFGKYDLACWETPGTGQFRPLQGADPHIGEVGKVERVPELRIEFTVADDCAAAVARALVAAHPYEEPAWGALRLAEVGMPAEDDETGADIDEAAWL
jgi:hypothetical protein